MIALIVVIAIIVVIVPIWKFLPQNWLFLYDLKIVYCTLGYWKCDDDDLRFPQIMIENVHDDQLIYFEGYFQKHLSL